MVQLKTIFGKEQTKSFELNHAQRILEVGKYNPPATWILDDEAYEMQAGKIVKKNESNSGSNTGKS